MPALIAGERPKLLSLLCPTSLIRCDKAPQKIGEPFGDVIFQDIAIMVAKAIAHRNQSLSSKFFCVMSLGAVHHPDPRGRSGMSEKAQTQCSFLMRLHKLL